MFRWRTGNLEAKLLFATIALFVGVVGAVSYVEHRVAVGLLKNELLAAANECAAGVAAGLREGIPEVSTLLDGLAAYENDHPELYDIAVFEEVEPGHLSRVASIRGTQVAAEEPALALRDGARRDRIVEVGGRRHWSVALPVSIQNGERRGVVAVWMSLASIDLLERRYTRMLLVTVPLSLALLTLLVHGVFRRMLHWPLGALGAAMAKVESGDLSVESPVFRPDEVGVIAKRFNRMVERLRAAVHEREELLTRVDGFNRELQLKVDEATRELEAKNRELQKTNAELYTMQRRQARNERLILAGQMTATFAHKLGTPLNLISGQVQTLLGRRPDEETLQEKLRVIYAQVERLTTIMRGLLDEIRQPVLDLKPLRLDELLGRMLVAIEPLLQSHEVRLERHLAEGAPPVMGDESQLEQVFTNLVNNSIDAMPEGGTLTISSEVVGERLEVRVSDSGEGISEDERSQIFRPLFTTKEIGRGTGLGLAIVKEILSAHGAGIRVESEVGSGATFILEFPLTPRTEEVVVQG